jgi:hypothetical protein
VNPQRIDLPDIESVIDDLVDDLGRFRSANQTLEDTAGRVRATLDRVAELNDQFASVEPKLLSAIELVAALNLDALHNDLAATDQRILRLISDLDVLRTSIAELRTIAMTNEQRLSEVAQFSKEQNARIVASLDSQFNDLERSGSQRQAELKSTLSHQERGVLEQINRLQASHLETLANQTRTIVAVVAVIGLLLSILIIIQ